MSNAYETGRVKFEKELEHTSGYTTTIQRYLGTGKFVYLLNRNIERHFESREEVLKDSAQELK